mmetsp:Transcript_43884/g.64455  ORF Transcript_43884/g.64455 Transcript_43884/m.64455 type:complete len:273 (-) Transcript_43884:271-1089(-)
MSDNALINRCKDERWSEAAELLNTKEGIEMANEKDKDGLFAIHAALSAKGKAAPDSLIFALIKAAPDACKAKDVYRSTVLHMAVKANSSTKVIEKLIYANPKAVDYTDAWDKRPSDTAPEGYNFTALEMLQRPAAFWISAVNEKKMSMIEKKLTEKLKKNAVVLDEMLVNYEKKQPELVKEGTKHLEEKVSALESELADANKKIAESQLESEQLKAKVKTMEQMMHSIELNLEKAMSGIGANPVTASTSTTTTAPSVATTAAAWMLADKDKK